MMNVSIRSGYVRELIRDSGDATGAWQFKDAPDVAVQMVVSGTDTVTSTCKIECSNDGVNVAVTATTLTPSGNPVGSAGAVVTGPWKYIRAVISGTTGTGAATTVIASE